MIIILVICNICENELVNRLLNGFAERISKWLYLFVCLWSIRGKTSFDLTYYRKYLFTWLVREREKKEMICTCLLLHEAKNSRNQPIIFERKKEERTREREKRNERKSFTHSLKLFDSLNS